MTPGLNELVVAVDARLGDPEFRERIRRMHAEGRPLVEMVGALGLTAAMSDRIAQILASLSPDVVAGIRAATLQMLDGAVYAMPVRCSVPDSDLDQPVAVEVLPENGTPTIHVRRA